jgi:AcrR family transcriptional regulator
MARPRSDDKRNAIVTAAIRTIASQGLSAPTALIAKEAGVSNGSLFTYFATKADLLNQLYVELKTEMGEAALSNLPAESDTREQMRHVWFHWLHWSISQPDKHRTLAQLGVSDEITAQSHQAASRGVAGIAKLVEQSRANGPMRDAPLGLVVALISGVADATMDFMLRDPAKADAYCAEAFDAGWRMIA